MISSVLQKADDKRDFFISRTGVDSAWAQWIAGVLENAGFTTYLQDWDFLPGQNFVRNMRIGTQCERVICVLSPEYLTAKFSVAELEAAFATGKYLPVRIRHCDLDPLLVPWIYLDLVGKTEDEAREALLNAVRAQRLKPCGPVSFPGKRGMAFSLPTMISVAKLPPVNPFLAGREEELKQLDSAWTNPAIRLVSIVAFGGVGKTSLSINWWHRNGAPGAARILGWSFYSQGTAEDRQASADHFLDYALREWFGVSNPPKDSWIRGEKLAEFIRRERTLLMLDGLEPIQCPPGPQLGRLKDPGMIALIKELAAHNPGLCICTSRLPLTDLEDYDNFGVLSMDLGNLSKESGASCLRQFGVQGDEDELQSASVDVGNHALALTLLGHYIVKRCNRDIRRRDAIPGLFAEPKRGGHARRILRQYEAIFENAPELEILRLLGLFDRPADSGALRLLRRMSEDEWAGAIENLAEARLIEYLGPDDPLNCHPLVREHFAESFRDSDGVGFREAHLRLYQYYAKKAPYRPNNLTEMDPLFYAVYHGCQAQRHTEVRNLVYRSRILRDDDFYLTRSLGAYGADLSLIAAFFTTPWTCVSDQLTLPLQGWILQRAGFLLHMNGRLSESIVPMGASVDIMERTLDRANQALFIGNLADLHLGLGQIEQAITLARRSVRLADNAHVLREQMVNRTVLADALHKAGKLQEAARQFGVAEEIQANYEKEFPALYSLAGYRYCEFLLSLGHEHEVAIRAKRALDWYGGNAPARDVAQDHLSLSRTCVPGSVEAASHLEVAIRELRLSGQRSLLPLGLLTRAAHHRQVRDFERAQRDLDEARIVATRCEMRLHLTDYHLEQARLFLAQSRDNEARCHYVAAKRLVEETGYHRRDIDLVSLGAKLAE